MDWVILLSDGGVERSGFLCLFLSSCGFEPFDFLSENADFVFVSIHERVDFWL